MEQSPTPPGPSEHPDFDAFLRELIEDGVTVELPEAFYDDFHDVFDKACAALGHQPLDEDNERSRSVWDDHFNHARETIENGTGELGIVDGQERSAMIRMMTNETFSQQRKKEELAYWQIFMASLVGKIKEAYGRPITSADNDRKTQLYADLIQLGVPADNPLIAVLDREIPGERLDASDPKLASFAITAIEKHANREARLEAFDQEVQRLYAAIGFDASDKSYEAKLHQASIVAVYVTGSTMDTSISAANREEHMYAQARKLDVAYELAIKIVAYVNATQPL